jgi:hypothetical protein
MLPSAKISEQAAVLATINPVSTNTTVTSGWVSAANCERFLALIQTGVLGTSATVDAKLQQATDASGTGVKDVTGKAITQIVKASGDNVQAEINLRAEELDVNGGFAFVRLSVTVGTAASLVSGVLLGGVAKNLPASAFNQAGVVQIV